jgi:hypothetical protein
VRRGRLVAKHPRALTHGTVAPAEAVSRGTRGADASLGHTRTSRVGRSMAAHGDAAWTSRRARVLPGQNHVPLFDCV